LFKYVEGTQSFVFPPAKDHHGVLATCQINGAALADLKVSRSHSVHKENCVFDFFRSYDENCSRSLTRAFRRTASGNWRYDFILVRRLQDVNLERVEQATFLRAKERGGK
jgi:GTP cyclohydrolase II